MGLSHIVYTLWLPHHMASLIFLTRLFNLLPFPLKLPTPPILTTSLTLPSLPGYCSTLSRTPHACDHLPSPQCPCQSDLTRGSTMLPSHLSPNAIYCSTLSHQFQLSSSSLLMKLSINSHCLISAGLSMSPGNSFLPILVTPN